MIWCKLGGVNKPVLDNAPAPKNAPARKATTAAERAYEAGDYREALQLARKDLGAPEQERQASAAALLRTLEPDWIQWAVLAACALVLGVVALVYAS